MLQNNSFDKELGAPDELSSQSRYLPFRRRSKTGAGIGRKASPGGGRKLRSGPQSLDPSQKTFVDESITSLEPPESTLGKDEGVSQLLVVEDRSSPGGPPDEAHASFLCQPTMVEIPRWLIPPEGDGGWIPPIKAENPFPIGKGQGQSVIPGHVLVSREGRIQEHSPA